MSHHIALMPTHVTHDLYMARREEHEGRFVGPKCNVCLNYTTLESLVITYCGHDLCRDCYYKIFDTCPTCRAPPAPLAPLANAPPANTPIVSRASEPLATLASTPLASTPLATLASATLASTPLAPLATLASTLASTPTDSALDEQEARVQAQEEETIRHMKRCFELIKEIKTIEKMGMNRARIPDLQRECLRLKSQMVVLRPSEMEMVEIEDQIRDYPQYGDRKLSVFIWNMYAMYAIKQEYEWYHIANIGELIALVNERFLFRFRSMPDIERPPCQCDVMPYHRCGIYQKRCDAGQRCTYRTSQQILENYNLLTIDPVMYMPYISRNTVQELEAEFNCCLTEKKEITVFTFRAT